MLAGITAGPLGIRQTLIIIIIIFYLYSALRELNLELGALQVLKKSMIEVI